MEEKILLLISKITQVDIAVLKNNLNTAGLWGSFIHIELIVNLESEFNIVFEQEEIATMKTPQIIIENVLKKVNK